MDAEIDRLKKSIDERQRGTDSQLVAGAVQTRIAVENIKNSYAQEQAALSLAIAQEKLYESQHAPGWDSKVGVSNVDIAKAALEASKQNESAEVAAAEARHKSLIDLAKQDADLAAKEAAERQKHATGNGTFDPDAGSKESKAHTLQMAHIREQVDALREQQSAEEAYITFRKKLDDARFNPSLFGPYVAAVIAEQRSIVETTGLVSAQADMVRKLQDLKNSPHLKPEDKVNLDTDIQRETSKYNAMKLSLQQQVELAKAAEAVRLQERDNAAAKAKSDVEAKYADALKAENLRGKFTKTGDPRDLAGQRGLSEANKVGNPDVQAEQDKVNAGLAEENLLLTERARIVADYEGDRGEPKDLTQIDAAIQALRQKNTFEANLFTQSKDRLAEMRKLFSDAAKENYDESQTAGAGWTKFWDDYSTKAQSAATEVEGILKSTTDSISKTIEKLATTGKWDWKSIANSALSTSAKNLSEHALTGASKLFTGSEAGTAAKSVSQDAVNTKLTTSLTALDASATSLATTGFTPLATMMGTVTAAAQAAAEALGRVAFNASLSSSGGGGGSGGSDAGYVMEGASLIADFAKGGIMTPYGPMSLRKYADGGVAHGPQVSVHGEGSLPEANVPLADGRSIPVSLKGGAGGGNVTSLTYSPVIHIDSRTDQAQVAHLVQLSVAQGNKQMLQHLKDVGSIG